MIPIDIDSWPHVNRELKEKLWLDVKVINYTTDTHNLFLIIFIVFILLFLLFFISLFIGYV